MAFCLAQKNSGLMCQTKQIEPKQIKTYLCIIIDDQIRHV